MRDVVFNAAQRFLRFVKMSGPNNIGGPCPFHKEGQERNPSFYLNLTNGLFYCHTCHVKGTFIQFLKRMGSAPEAIDAAMELAARQPKKRFDPVKEDVGRGQHLLNEALLGVFQYCPTDLVNEGFDKAVLQRLEIGFDKREMRITFPLRDLYGNLIGISGRTVIEDDERYKVYKSKDFLQYAPDDPEVEARYRAYDIKNHHFMWNMHNVYPEAFYGELDTVVVVEGYKACIWLIQQGIENVVALQGSRMTRAQERVLSRLGATIVLFLDNNKAGKEGTHDSGRRLRKRGLKVIVPSYPDGCEASAQPDNLTQPEILGVFDAAEDWHFWRQRSCNHIQADKGRHSVRE